MIFQGQAMEQKTEGHTTPYITCDLLFDFYKDIYLKIHLVGK